MIVFTRSIETPNKVRRELASNGLRMGRIERENPRRCSRLGTIRAYHTWWHRRLPSQRSVRYQWSAGVPRAPKRLHDSMLVRRGDLAKLRGAIECRRPRQPDALQLPRARPGVRLSRMCRHPRVTVRAIACTAGRKLAATDRLDVIVPPRHMVWRWPRSGLTALNSYEALETTAIRSGGGEQPGVHRVAALSRMLTKASPPSPTSCASPPSARGLRGAALRISVTAPMR